ncbi:hypothetical protein [Nocardioides jiangxiensis]|uniref:Uncharacterized protein n=1 Tax=Nocardioides jiangxiensis TaxID=3064524 RepID=A0ABT9B1T7_9ACTN|nr:hypothetical protein [Nocardioides sp. WY-20]MDO7868826.1 hypothetical protein [Nocardioides sp. WY-20]
MYFALAMAAVLVASLAATLWAVARAGSDPQVLPSDRPVKQERLRR